MLEKTVIEESWKQLLQPEFELPYFQQLDALLSNEKEKGILIFPPANLIFEAFNKTAFTNVKVVILGQDPYHGIGQAHGLCFSVDEGIPIPPSLKNIFKELKTDLGIDIPNKGNLSKWASQGVLLLNTTLTVRENEANSHQNKGWETFTDKVIQHTSNQKEHVVFILWGKFAQSKNQLIDNKKHLVLEAAHPSPLSAYNGFFGCKHFSKTNYYLQQNHLEPIDWQL
jgi:uracil-DNA glycosylase